MKRNMGTADRLIRTFLIAPGAVAWAAWLGLDTTGGIILLAVAAIMLATSAVAFCPLYALSGISTVRRRKEIPAAGSSDAVRRAA